MAKVSGMTAGRRKSVGALLKNTKIVERSSRAYTKVPLQTSKKSLRGIAKDMMERGLDDLVLGTHKINKPFPIAQAPKEIISFAREKGIKLGDNSKIYISPNRIGHTFRDGKVKEVSIQAFLSLPSEIKNMSIYYDKSPSHPSFVLTNGREKFIVKPERNVKVSTGKKQLFLYITAETVTRGESFNDIKYEKLK